MTSAKIRVKISELFGMPNVPEKETMEKRVGIFENVPTMDPQYLFRTAYLVPLLLFFRGDEPRAMLLGDTGAGKTTLLEQAANRLNWPVVPVACHDKLELQELIGRVSLNSDGSTGWVDGPVISAMRQGAVLILDEGNFMDQGAAGGLNKILDSMGGGSGTGYYLIPETGEVIKAHPDFRIALTGNQKKMYRGTKPMNLAFQDRFTLGINVLYMSLEEEVAMLKAKAPTLNERIIRVLTEAAKGIRATFDAGEIGTTLSTRVLISACTKLQMYGSTIEGQCAGISQALQMSVLYRASPEDADAIKKAVSGTAQRAGLEVNIK